MTTRCVSRVVHQRTPNLTIERKRWQGRSVNLVRQLVLLVVRKVVAIAAVKVSVEMPTKVSLARS